MDRISVIIPAYNREGYLGETIESVLAQTRGADEILVVDDGSTDRTAEVARRFPQVTCLSQANQGLSSARNAGIRAAKGELIALLDSDDLWLPRKLELQVEFLRDHPEISLAFCQVQMFRSPELTAEVVPAFNERELPGFLASCVTIRRGVFDQAGFFDTSLKGGEFIDWCGRAQDAGLISHALPELLVRRRVHLSNMAGDRALMNHDYLRILKNQLARRRASSSAIRL